MPLASEIVPPPIEADVDADDASNNGPAEAGLAEDLASVVDGLDRVLSAAASVEGDAAARRRAAEGLSRIAAELAGPGSERPSSAGALASLHPVTTLPTADLDDFGLDPAYEVRLAPAVDFLFERWFRVVCDGIDHVPAEGPALLVANHSGTLPLDGLMLRWALRREHPAHRDLRWLTEDFVAHLPFLGTTARRLGAVRACQENAECLLRRGSAVSVFPEGIQGTGKLYKDRYRLQRFGRGGYIKLALRTQAPIVPVAIVGAEETQPLLFRFTNASRFLGIPYVPVTPTFPWLGPLGLVPLPTRWRIRFSEPVELGHHGPEAASDAVLVQQLNDRVRGSIQTMLDSALRARTSVFFG